MYVFSNMDVGGKNLDRSVLLCKVQEEDRDERCSADYHEKWQARSEGQCAVCGTTVNAILGAEKK
jgi:hypothetical protein